MQGGNMPIKYQEAFKLSTIGVNPDNFRVNNVTLESEKYICVKDGEVSFLNQS